MEELEDDFLDSLVGESEDEEQVEQPESNTDDGEEEQYEDSDGESEYYQIYDVIKSYGIEDGMVQYGDEKVHISDLNYDEQMDVIGQLRELELEKLSNTPEFDENEWKVLQQANEHGLTLNEYIDAIREQDKLQYEKELESIVAQIRLESSLPAINELSDDDVMLLHLKRTLGEDATMEEIQEALEERKALRTYSKEVDKLRVQLNEEQENYKNLQLEQERIENEQYVKEHQIKSAQAINKLNSIAGFDVDDELKNHIYNKIAGVDDNYDTFITKHFVHDPEMQAKAIWFLEHENELSEYISNLENKIKSAYHEGYNKGKNDLVKNKFPSTRPVKQVTTNSSVQEDNFLDSLY